MASNNRMILQPTKAVLKGFVLDNTMVFSEKSFSFFMKGIVSGSVFFFVGAYCVFIIITIIIIYSYIHIIASILQEDVHKRDE